MMSINNVFTTYGNFQRIIIKACITQAGKYPQEKAGGTGESPILTSFQRVK